MNSRGTVTNRETSAIHITLSIPGLRSAEARPELYPQVAVAFDFLRKFVFGLEIYSPKAKFIPAQGMDEIYSLGS